MSTQGKLKKKSNVSGSYKSVRPNTVPNKSHPTYTRDHRFSALYGTRPKKIDKQLNNVFSAALHKT